MNKYTAKNHHIAERFPKVSEYSKTPESVQRDTSKPTKTIVGEATSTSIDNSYIQFCAVYSEIVLAEPDAEADRPGSFEKPPNFPTDVIYPSLGSPAENLIPIEGNPYLIQKRTVRYGELVNGETIDDHLVLVTFLDPFKDAQEQPDIVYHIDVAIPTVQDASIRTRMVNYVNSMRATYGVSE